MNDSNAPDNPAVQPSRPRTVFDGFRRPTPPPPDSSEEALQSVPVQTAEETLTYSPATKAPPDRGPIVFACIWSIGVGWPILLPAKVLADDATRPEQALVAAVCFGVWLAGAVPAWLWARIMHEPSRSRGLGGERTAWRGGGILAWFVECGLLLYLTDLVRKGSVWVPSGLVEPYDQSVWSNAMRVASLEAFALQLVAFGVLYVFGWLLPKEPPRPIADLVPDGVSYQTYEIRSGIVAYELEPLDEEAERTRPLPGGPRSGVGERSRQPSEGSRVFRLVVKSLLRSLLMAAPIGIIMWGFVGFMTGARWDDIFLAIAYTTAFFAVIFFFPLLILTSLRSPR